jgi:hypothetical protein
MSDTTDEYLLTVSVDVLLDYWDPFEMNVWGCSVTPEDVKNCEDISVGALPAALTEENPDTAEYNAARIAWLVVNGWDDVDATHPITFDVGLPGYTPEVLLVDGNHRFAAALIRGDTTITLSIIGGIDKADAVFFGGEDLYSI